MAKKKPVSKIVIPSQSNSTDDFINTLLSEITALKDENKFLRERIAEALEELDGWVSGGIQIP